MDFKTIISDIEDKSLIIELKNMGEKKEEKRFDSSTVFLL